MPAVPWNRDAVEEYGGTTMNDFASLLNGLSADERVHLIDSAQDFLKHRDGYDLCPFCGKNLTDLVCDAPIGFEWTGDPSWPMEKRFTVPKAEMLTCDLIVCESCLTKGDPLFFCGPGESGHFICSNGECDMSGGSEIFVPDLCPLHRDEPSLGSTNGWVFTPDEIKAWRARTQILVAEGKVHLAEKFPRIR